MDEQLLTEVEGTDISVSVPSKTDPTMSAMGSVHQARCEEHLRV